MNFKAERNEKARLCKWHERNITPAFERLNAKNEVENVEK